MVPRKQGHAGYGINMCVAGKDHAGKSESAYESGGETGEGRIGL
jgi:hypothetical protein